MLSSKNGIELRSQVMSTTTSFVTDISGSNGHTKKTVNRCPQCSVKLLLTDITCKCGIKFCSKHRHAGDGHTCSFDHKSAGIALLQSSLPQVIGNKMKDKL